MKKLNEWLMMSLVALSLFVSACSSSSDDEPTVPEFPAFKTINATAGSEQTFSFTANMDWKLSSNKTWCTLATTAMEGQNISGQSGSQSVKIKVSDAGQDFEAATATLTLTMGGESEAVAEIIRAGKEYELKVYDANGDVVTSLAIGSEGTLAFSVEANFEVGIQQYPNWMTVEVTTDENGKKNITMVVKDEYTKNPITGDSLVFANSTGNVSISVPVSYKGMDPEKVIIKSKDIESGSFWNWTVSLDGKTFSKQNDLTNETNTITEKMTFNITALNDGYHPVFIKKSNDEYDFEDVEWMHLTQNGETAVFTVDASDKERNGVVLVFPTAVYNQIKGDLMGNVIEDGAIKYIYEQKYFLVSFTQKDDSETGFLVKHGLTQKEITCNAETNEELLEYIGSSYSVQAIYSINVAADSPLMIYPNLSSEEWEVSSENSFFINWLDGSSCTNEEMRMRPEGGLDGSNNPYIMIRTPQQFNQAIFIVFKGIDTLNKKVLIIKPE